MHTVHSRLLLFFILAVPVSAFAGAWVPSVGSGYQKFALNYFEADDFFGENDEFESFESEFISYYFEVGVAKDLAVFGSLPLQDLSQTIGGQETSSFGLGDVELGLRYNLINGPFVLSTAFTFKAPYFYDEDAELPRGNGQEDFEGRLLFGKSLNEYGYFGIEAGYRFRTDDPSDEFRYLIEYGFNATENLYFRTKLDGIQAIGNATVSEDIFGNLSTPVQFDLGRLELTTGWNFGKPRSAGSSRWGLEFTYTRDLYGNNTLQGNTFQVGLTYVN